MHAAKSTNMLIASWVVKCILPEKKTRNSKKMKNDITPGQSLNQDIALSCATPKHYLASGLSGQFSAELMLSNIVPAGPGCAADYLMRTIRCVQEPR